VLPTPLNKPLAEWTAADVQFLVDERIEEGQRLEYKRQLDLGRDPEKREAAKDASGLANAQGGLLIYGVAEETLDDGRRVPTGTTPIEDGRAQDRLEAVLDSVVSPRLNKETQLLDADGGGYFLAVRLFQRSGPLHMVEGFGQNRYFIRSGVSTTPMAAHEVERAFADVAAGESRLASAIGRLPIVPRLSDVGHPGRPDLIGEAGTEQQAGWISLVCAPLDPTSGRLFVVDQRQMEDWSHRVIQLDLTHRSFRRDADGLHVDDLDEDGFLQWRFRLYPTGVIEWGERAVSTLAPERRLVPSGRILLATRLLLAFFAECYRDTGYYGRVRVLFALGNALGTTLALPPSWLPPYTETALQRADVDWATDTNVEALMADVLPVTRTLMDDLWMAFGYSRCQLFDDDGNLKA
jgi:hypothetical protein